MNTEFYGSYIYHHGIKGQKWGHKNGPPYPLDESDHSTSEKKAGWKKSLDDGSDSSSSRSFKRSIKKLKKLQDRANIDLQKERAENYSERAKKAAKVAIASGSIAAGAAGIGGKIIEKGYKDNSEMFTGALNKSREAQREVDKAFNESHALNKAVAEAIGVSVSELDYKTGVNDRYSKGMHEVTQTRLDALDKSYKNKDKLETLEAAKKVVIGASLVTAGVAGGVYGYNRVQQALSERRITEEGHAEAVKKAKEQTQKILDKYGDISIADINKAVDELRKAG